MGDPGLELVSDLLAATTQAHSPRALVLAVAPALATRMAVVRVELAQSDPPVTAVLVAGTWRCVAAEPTSGATAIVPGLNVVATRALPAFLARGDVRRALAEVVRAAVRHVDVVRRVAQSSRRAHGENRLLRADLHERTRSGAIVARSQVMRAALRRVELVARHPTSVLLAGESGSGKEVLAQEIHQRSPRAHRPMVQINCGAISPALVESELFGHERGAFTGADRAHVGAFERAHRGTLFLDEIGELPAPAQASLLRVLQERCVRRVGGEREIEVDVRLIAATNRDLEAMVDAGTFRGDLYYRLNVFAIHVPSLRDRRGDLAPLVAELVRELARKLAMSPPPISRADLARLEAHHWPGNVRELMNVLETGMILGGGKAIELPDEVPRRGHANAERHRFDHAVRAAIESALTTSRGKIYGAGGAAALLGLKPATLQSKMIKLGITRAAFARSSAAE